MTTHQSHCGALICLVSWREPCGNPARSAAKLQCFLPLQGEHVALVTCHQVHMILQAGTILCPLDHLHMVEEGEWKKSSLYFVLLDVMIILACWLLCNISVHWKRKCLSVPNGKGRAVTWCHLYHSSSLLVMPAGHLVEREIVLRLCPWSMTLDDLFLWEPQRGILQINLDLWNFSRQAVLPAEDWVILPNDVLRRHAI